MNHKEKKTQPQMQNDHPKRPAIRPKSIKKKSATPITTLIRKLSGGAAIIGGFVLMLLVCLTATSVLGRTLFSAPLNGDFEIVKMGCAIAVFYFLPWTQLSGGHLAVRLEMIPAAFRPWPDAAGNLLFLVFAILLFLYIPRGGLALRAYGEETVVLAIPVWWAHVAVTPALIILLLVGIHHFHRSYAEVAASLRHPQRSR